MIARGFFSGFVAVMGVLLLVALFYSQSSRDEAVYQSDELLIAHSLLSKDWSLARNAYVSFASDAMAQQIVDSGSCSVSGGANFTDRVESSWGVIRSHLLSEYGVDCVAVLDVDLQNELEGTAFASPVVSDNAPAYGLLTCTRDVGGSPSTIQHPFVIWKDVRTIGLLPNQCEVSVRDMVGPPPYEGLEVQHVFNVG